MKIIIGLGNPGSRYFRTRHNLGARVLDEIASRHDVRFNKQSKLRAEIAKLPTDDVILVKPATYMNESGAAASLVANYYKAAASDILLISDDTNLDFGVARLRASGSDGGHNGLKSVISALGPEFIRLRLGVGNQALSAMPLENFVLDKFSPAEEKALPDLIKKAVDLAEEFIAGTAQHLTIR